MAQMRDNPSSPRSSSGGAESFKGTPDTRLTAFSPEVESSNKSSKLVKNLPRSNSATPTVRLPVNSYRGTAPNLDKDPFITPDHGHGTRLSPTASTFNPFVNSINLPSSGGSGPVSAALSSELGLSRHLDVSSQTPVSAIDVNILMTELSVNGDHQQGIKHLASRGGHIYLYFADIRAACAAQATIRQSDKGWKAEYVNYDQLSKNELAPFEPSIVNAGQVLVLAIILAGSNIGSLQAIDTVQGYLESHGHLFAFIRQATFPDGSFKAVAEFCDISAAVLSMANCNKNVIVEGVHIVLSLHESEATTESDLAEALQDISLTNGGDQFQHQISTSHMATPHHMTSTDLRVHQPFTIYPLMLHAPFTPGMPYVIDSFLSTSHANSVSPITSMKPSYPVLGSLYETPPSPALTVQNSYSLSRPLSGLGRADARRQNAMRVSRSSYHSVTSHHNHVDISRIRDGIDVRTTIMLRNIPNKVDQAMLKRIVDESSWGKYDFMYLRIDFANDCNVGYAFINFVDPLDIIDFVDARGNQRWNCFKSDKVAEISYATIQGKDCLVQKFRNSSVMLEAAHYRPKLYFTSNGPMPDLAGQEEPFPDPDNQSKMKRSCENAEHVGLFTPNAGQHFRDEQRRRRSQYDRGTRLAALEEYDYEAAIQHLYATGSQ